uniref:Agenet-like domain-containing protein n=1 Tax=Setaria italica TaxID=4555 RepID=K3XT67_SETIT
MPATIIKMVGSVNYVVSYGNREDSTEVLHSCFIQPQPVFDKTKFENELEPSAEVEVYQDGIWSLGVIEDVCICEPRRYKVRVKHHGNAYDYFLVSSTSLRPYSKGDSQEWKPCSTKGAERRFGEGRTALDTHFKSQATCSQIITKDVMDMETIPEKEATVVKQLESEGKCLGFRVAKGKDQILATSCHTSVPEKLIDTQCDGKGRRFLPKVHPALFRILVSYHCNSIALLSSSVLKKCWHSKRLVHFLGTLFIKFNDFDVVVISDDSGYENFIEISDTSYTLFPLESSQDPSHNDGGLLRISETKEPALSDNLHLETAMMSLGDTAAGDEPDEMCQKVAEVKSWMAGACKGADISLINSRNCINPKEDAALPIGVLEPSSTGQQDAKADLLCIQAPNEDLFPAAEMIADEPHPQHNVSSQNSFGQLEVSISGKSSGPSSFVHSGMTVDLSTLMPLPVPSSSNLASAIKNMRIQDEARLYQEKMNSLLDLEENGFQVGPLKVRLNNLLCTRNRQISLKNRKAKGINCRLEQQIKFVDMCTMGVEEKKYQEMKAFVDMQKVANCLSISKLQVDLLQVEESLASVEADFGSIAAAPWESDVGFNTINFFRYQGR